MYNYSAPDPRDSETFHFRATPLRRATLGLVRVLFRPLMDLDAEGLEHIPAEGPFILASNHINNWDVFAMQLAMPRTIFFMGKAELFKFGPLAAVLRNFGAFPVYRGEKDAWALGHAVRVLQSEQVLGMFPEGHRSLGKGLLGAKTGTARLSISANCPILPMAIIGTEKFMRTFPQRTPVHVAFLPMLQAQAGESPEELTRRLMRVIAAALPPAARGVYA